MRDPIALFHMAEGVVLANGYGQDIEHVENRPSFNEVDENYFLREYAWVVLNSGFRWKVIAEKWRDLTKAFRHFFPIIISDHKEKVRTDALKIFGNKRKVDAIINTACKIVEEGFEAKYRKQIQNSTLETLESLPMIGKVTKYHLARNLGFDYVKPDRHLTRLADRYGMTSLELCNCIQAKTGRCLGTIDVILWRFMEQGKQRRLTEI